MADIINELISKVTDAYHAQTPLAIIAGGSKIFMGRNTSGSVLDVAGHSGIISYQPVELVITARAGTSIAEIVTVLAENNQSLAFEPPCFSDKSTLGGTLACNQSGPARPWCGSIRDHVLGVGLINGKGEHLKFGGQVMKNVAGYDVSRLQAGAMGTLGVLTQISLKVMPKPDACKTLVWNMDAAQAIVFMNRLGASAKPISAACWFEGQLYVRLSGVKTSIDATIKQWKGQIKADPENLWQKLADQQLAFFTDEAPLWRFSVNPTAQITALDEHSIIDWGGALRWYQGEGDLAAMQKLAAAAGGQVSMFSGGNRNAEVMHHLPKSLQSIQARIKKSFDPHCILNPGRLYSWM